MISTRTSHPLREVLLSAALLLLVFVLVLIGLRSPSQLDRIQRDGVLRVGTINSPLTYYLERGEPAGFEYELARAFANYLDVDLEIHLSHALPELFQHLSQRSVHLLAAGLHASGTTREQYHASPVYRETASTVIYRLQRGQPAPRSIEDLYDRSLGVIAGSSQDHLLQELQQTHPQLRFQRVEDADAIDLLRAVHEGELEFTLLDAFFFDTQQSFFPGLQRAFPLSQPQPVAWLSAPHADHSLQKALQRFFNQPQTQQLISELEERYFTMQNPLNFFDTVSFRSHLLERFLPLEDYFDAAAELTGLDRILLAAVAYQESHWNPDAVSPTGVRGIMMLTNAAASEVNVSDRTDAEQSIMGGAQYLLNMKARIPERIPEPDHTWFALAAYNVGLGHLMDARRLTQRYGHNPDNWDDVRRHLPLLSQERYYTQTRHGYARGHEPVRYVDNIRKYMDLLQWEFHITLNRDGDRERVPDVDELREQSERILRTFAPSL